MFGKHKTLFIIVIPLILLWAGIYFLLPKTDEGEILLFAPPKEKVRSFEEQEKEALETAKNNSEIFNQAQQKQDEWLCESITDDPLRSECRDRVVIAKIGNSWDMTLCEDITDESRKTNCRDLIALNSAREIWMKALCARISNENDIKRCREDIDGKRLATVLAEKSATPQICASFEENFQKECLRSIDTFRSEEQYLTAIKTKNLAACDAVTEPQLQTDCRDNILLERAVSEWNNVLCRSITSPEKQSYCVKKWDTQADISTFKAATSGKSLEECRTINDGSLRNRCHDIVTLDLVRESKDARLCDTLTNTGIIENCKRIEP